MSNQTTEQQPHFSVLIANYNNGQYLEECLQSVFDQTFTNWEHLIMEEKTENYRTKTTTIFTLKLNN